jgi:hypothetical protein
VGDHLAVASIAALDLAGAAPRARAPA